MCALIPAAGRGARFGATQNKVFTPLAGRPLLTWTLEVFARCAEIEAIVIVGQFVELPLLHDIAKQFGGGKVRAIVPGGPDRQSSVRNGLIACAGFDYVAIHDAARCGITLEVIQRTVAMAQEKKASAVAALPLADTLALEASGSSETRQIAGYIPRDNLWTIQTPQIFPLELIQKAHEAAHREGVLVTDDTQLIRRLNQPIYLALGSPQNFKVTRPEDTAVMEAVLKMRPFRHTG